MKETMTSAKSLLPASDTTPILAPSTYDIRNISMKLPYVIFGRLICHGYRGWIIPYARTFTIYRSGINLSLHGVYAIVHHQSPTGKHYNYRHWYINECRCRGSMLWPMSPAYYHQMAVNLWVSKNIDRRNYIMYHLQEPLGHYRAYVLR